MIRTIDSLTLYEPVFAESLSYGLVEMMAVVDPVLTPIGAKENDYRKSLAGIANEQLLFLPPEYGDRSFMLREGDGTILNPYLLPELLALFPPELRKYDGLPKKPGDKNAIRYQSFIKQLIENRYGFFENIRNN